MEKGDSLVSIISKSFYYALKEWKILLGMIIIGFFNLYAYFETFATLFVSKKIYYSILQFVLLMGYFMLIGRLSRKIYNKEPLGYFSLLKRSFYSSFVFFAFVVLWFAFMFPVKKILTTNIWVFYILNIVYLLLLTSVILECVRSFFLDVGVFSLYDVFKRVGSKNYLLGYVLTAILVLILYPISNNLTSFLTHISLNLFFIKSAYFIFHAIVFGYITLVVLMFFLKVMDLDNM